MPEGFPYGAALVSGDIVHQAPSQVAGRGFAMASGVVYDEPCLVAPRARASTSSTATGIRLPRRRPALVAAKFDIVQHRNAPASPTATAKTRSGGALPSS